MTTPITSSACSAAANKCDTGNAGKKACVDCTSVNEIDAVIVFPTLGAPQILQDGAAECTVIVATNSYGRNQLLDECKGAVMVNHHLRMISLEYNKDELCPPCDHKLYDEITDDYHDPQKKYNKTNGAMLRDKFIEINELTKDSTNMLYWPKKDEDGKQLTTGWVFKDPVQNVIGRLSVDAVSLYVSNSFTEYFAITLKNMKVRPGPTPKSWAWIVTTTDFTWHQYTGADGKRVPLKDCPKVHQPIDRIIHNQLRKYSNSNMYFTSTGGMLEKDGLCEVLVEGGEYGTPQSGKGNLRVQAWHPVMTKPNQPLKLGHLTDSHISVRAATIGRSPVRVIEDSKAQGRHFDPVGERVAHTYKSFKELIDVVKTKGADALAITGDVVDFNRNLNPEHTKGMNTVGEIWRVLNVIGNVFYPKNGYCRGIDQLYFYSLLLYALRRHNMPAYYITGNHEGYQWPYGISPRVGVENWSDKGEAVSGSFSGTSDNYSGNMYHYAKKEKDAYEEMIAAERYMNDPKLAYSYFDQQNAKKSYETKKAKHETAAKASQQFYSNSIDQASEYHQKKATECIPSDHNLTIYEACLAFGPTYGQVLTSDNFRGEQFDWIHWLYTPFSDLNVYPCCKSIIGEGAKQAFTLLGWGRSERLLPFVLFAVTGNDKAGEDRRGAGFLPYAPESINKKQREILAAASEVKSSKWTVLSHFTMANFQDSVPASVDPSDTGFLPSDGSEVNLDPKRIFVGDTKAQFNYFNWGGCEQGLKMYFEKYASLEAAPQPGQVNMHLSGHSHRSGVYTLKKRKSDPRDGVSIECRIPNFPGNLGKLPSPGAGTQFIVGTTAGPMGKQALSGRHWLFGSWSDNAPGGKGEYKWNPFLGGWLTRPPSGLVVDTGSGKIEYAVGKKDIKRNDIPRLPVMLDYREIMSLAEKAHAYRPIVFCPPPFLGETIGTFVEQKTSLGRTCFAEGLPVKISSEMKKLDCLDLDKVYLWVYKAGPKQEKPASSGEGAPASSPPSSENQGGWQRFPAPILRDDTIQFANNGKFIYEALTPKMDARGKPIEGVLEVLCAFIEIGLKQPKRDDVPWSEVKWQGENWVFPVDIERVQENEIMRRGERETGEIPKWKFLEKYGGDKYPKPGDAVWPTPPQKT